jgi:hypothetical protein
MMGRLLLAQIHPMFEQVSMVFQVSFTASVSEAKKKHNDYFIQILNSLFATIFATSVSELNMQATWSAICSLLTVRLAATNEQEHRQTHTRTDTYDGLQDNSTLHTTYSFCPLDAIFFLQLAVSVTYNDEQTDRRHDNG